MLSFPLHVFSPLKVTPPCGVIRFALRIDFIMIDCMAQEKGNLYFFSILTSAP